MVNQSGDNWIEPTDKAAAKKTRSGEQLVKANCGDCHHTGKDGAPKIRGNKSGGTRAFTRQHAGGARSTLKIQDPRWPQIGMLAVKV